MKSLLTKCKWFLLLISLTFITSCATVPPPKQPNNVCAIFHQYPDWYWAAEDVQRHWGLPIPILMAIIFEESHYQASAKTPEKHILWVIPWGHESSAYGYSQALQGTWEHYRQHENRSWLFTSRDNFSDAADFVGWYTNRIHHQAHVPMTDSYHLYLAYHEGIGGYQAHTYLKKPWLIEVAKKVQRQAWLYKVQLQSCQADLPDRPWYHFW